MKHHLLTLAIALASVPDCHAQPAWEKVPPSVTKGGNEQRAVATSKRYEDKDYNYGSETNPSPRMDAVAWSTAGTFWIFGGIGLDEKYQWGMFQDLWNYDPQVNTWHFVKGNRNLVSTDADSDNQSPKARKEAASWVDAKGNLWLHGGRQLGDLLHLDDMWKFDTQAKTWTKIIGKGSFNSKPSWGVQKSANTDNSPGSRSSATTWTDKNGNLWLFGGVSYNPKEGGEADYYNDLWMFDINKNQWSWISGDKNPNQPAVVSIKKDNVPTITPSSRSNAVCWYQSEEDQLWLFGGLGIDSTTSHVSGLSDMWVYSLAKNTWELKNGSLAPNLPPNIFSARTTDINNNPGARISSVGWIGRPGYFYLVGGNSKITTEQISIDKNIWVYSSVINQWSILPQKQIPSISSANSFADQKGNAYLFGGKEFDEKSRQFRVSNSVWKLNQQ